MLCQKGLGRAGWVIKVSLLCESLRSSSPPSSASPTAQLRAADCKLGQQPDLFLSRKGSAPGLGFTDFWCPRRNLGARHWGSPVSLGHL